MLAGCGPEGPPSSLGPSDSSALPASGRYAVQWTGYVAGFEGEPIFAQLAFFDVGPQTSEPAIHELELLSKSGPVEATVEAITPGHSDSGAGIVSTSMFSALIRIDGLAPGRHEWNEVRYVDESREARQVRVGSWVVEIRDGPPGTDLREIESSIGSTSFGTVETVLENSSVDPLEIMALAPVDLPDIETEATMNIRADASSGPHPSSEPAVAPALERVDSVVVTPGDSARIVFEIRQASPGELSFAVVRPLVTYRYDRQAAVRYFGLPMQVYAPPLAGLDGTLAYLHSLPPDAFHRLGDT